MTYDFSFDGKSLWGLLAGSVVLCALLFFAGLLVGVGWGEKPTAAVAGAQVPAQGAPAAAPAQSSVAPAPAPYASGRREAERLSARAADPDPRLVSEADGASQYSAGAAQPTPAPGYSVQVGAYLEEKEARRLVEDL